MERYGKDKVGLKDTEGKIVRLADNVLRKRDAFRLAVFLTNVFFPDEADQVLEIEKIIIVFYQLTEPAVLKTINIRRLLCKTFT